MESANFLEVKEPISIVLQPQLTLLLDFYPHQPITEEPRWAKATWTLLTVSLMQ